MPVDFPNVAPGPKVMKESSSVPGLCQHCVNICHRSGLEESFFSFFFISVHTCSKTFLTVHLFNLFIPYLQFY